MKVLGFVGSPRKKGNTDILVDTFLKGAESAGAEMKKHFLAKIDIKQCRGCFRNCMVKPEYLCPILKDDMNKLQEEMVSSDLMLFASPLYCATYSSIMARFFERCISFLEFNVVGKEGTKEGVQFVNNPMRGKKAVLGLVHDLKNPVVGELPLKVFEHVVGRNYMMDIVGKIQVPDVRDKGDIKKKTERLEEIFELGKKLATP